MKSRNGAIVALLLLATCSEYAEEQDPSNIESAKVALGKVPASEVAVWQKVGSSKNPDGRYLQAVAFDETRKVVVMFGGTNMNPNTGTVAPNRETWEWSPATGKWTNRTAAGTAPDARSGAAMVYDSLRGKFVLFGGRAGSGFNFEDTWEWDPTTGAWTNVSAAGAHPTARAQHGMVYEKSTGKILLFGGGRSDSASYDGSGMSISLGDTWEYEPVAHAWTQLTVAGAPSVRHDFGMVWDSSRNVAVLFGGLQTDIAGASGVPKQDTWEWSPTTSAWTERTAAGNKPSQRYAHAMAFDGSRKKAMLFGGWDISTGGSRNDLWDWDPVTGAWTERLTGSEAGVPSARMYASLVSDDTGARLELVAGATAYNPYGGTGGYYGSGGSTGIVILPPVPVGVGYGATGTREVWELNPVTPAFTNRTAPLDLPASRYNHAMAYNPVTGKTCVFGGYDATTGQPLDDLWEWDGKTWAEVATDIRPPARSDAAMAYDPARKSLILFGGNDNYSGNAYGDTWEFGSTRKWIQLSPASSPDALMDHGMVSDTTRNKILLFGGQSGYMWLDSAPYKDPIRNEVWEWDGATMTWTNRTPSTSAPTARTYPIMAYDEGRQKLFLFDGANYGSSPTQFWEWDPLSAGWAMRNTGDALTYGYNVFVAYDSIRRREVLLTSNYNASTGLQETWELDARGPTFYVRALANSPGTLNGATMAFDSVRGVAVLFGGGQSATTGNVSSETWEYTVSNLGNGEGCTAAFAATCASGYCVDGVCCAAAACTGACQSCNVAGSEGTCIAAKAGTEVAGSCAIGQSCDGSGTCKTKNGQACVTAAACASGFCADGVCCDGACTGTCASCNLAGQVGKCSPYAAGSDPQGECGKGVGVCKSTCNGVGACDYPQTTVTCGTCYTCDGYGSCSNYDYYCGSYGGSYGGSGGYGYGGGNYGGAAGSPNYGGSGGGIRNYGGNAGNIPNLGGSGGNTPSYGGNAGAGDTSPTTIHHSGCGCRLGQRRPASSSLAEPCLIAGAALLLTRRRRRSR